MWWVYIVRCKDNSLYCGVSNNVEKRIKTHNAGNGAKYTKTRLPVKLVYLEECDGKITALKREYHIKQLSKKEKEILVEKYNAQ